MKLFVCGFVKAERGAKLIDDGGNTAHFLHVQLRPCYAYGTACLKSCIYHMMESGCSFSGIRYGHATHLLMQSPVILARKS